MCNICSLLSRAWQVIFVYLFQCLSSNSTFESSDQVNGWMLDMCCMMLSLKSYGLSLATHVQSYDVLNNPLLERVLTSHLQTFGCTVVMGTSSEDVNSVSYIQVHKLHVPKLIMILNVVNIDYSCLAYGCLLGCAM
jgi:hypothetical protein